MGAFRISIANAICGNGSTAVSALHKCMHNLAPANNPISASRLLVMK